MALNCASIPESLFESELFGYEPGAFSGAATQGKPGRFELANNGTLFLDEIGELSPTLQAKLLRAIETREIDKIGGKKPIKINTRLISATNRNLLADIKKSNFRNDLYHRLATITIELPPLRYRRDDIILLANHFLTKMSERTNRQFTLSVSAYKHLLEYRWPGKRKGVAECYYRRMCRF
ncbi:Sigma-54 interaction domain-containing protein [Desulfotomaculum arcticum]|uniref:Sigma-54 interaction domain-containing protein n=1 Tax=Desulfotruncus arcticus DSM 17038 TaxID=1121424 RepID=A0A1I2P4N0_9FIRM|nr:Sigma-54 interaction domain-containing protein [Desulfotomaculum arcticum] [Desulfotruncus arcticus DSM 17038]